MIRSAWICIAWIALTLVAGCSQSPHVPSPTVTSASRNVRDDACGARMHDLSEAILLFYLRNQRLPDSLDELKRASDPTLQWVCPATHLPYVYDRVGYYDMQKRTRIVLFDATPAHLGMRWAVQITEPADRKQAIVAEVVLKPESIFLMRGGK